MWNAEMFSYMYEHESKGTLYLVSMSVLPWELQP